MCTDHYACAINFACFVRLHPLRTQAAQSLLLPDTWAVCHRCIAAEQKRNTILLWLDNCEHQAMHIIPDSILRYEMCARAVCSRVAETKCACLEFPILILFQKKIIKIYFQFPFASASSLSESPVSGGALGHGPNV